eukprot:g3684.t1
MSMSLPIICRARRSFIFIECLRVYFKCRGNNDGGCECTRRGRVFQHNEQLLDHADGREERCAGNYRLGVPLFKRLPESDLPLLAQAMQVKTFAASIGDKGDAFYVIQSGEANVLVHETNYLQVGDKVKCLKDLHFGGKKILKGSLATVDKYDASREFPYTIRVAETGYRGRVLPEEVEPLSGPPPEQVVATLRAGDYFGEQSLLRGAARAATISCKTELTTFCLTREKFKQFNLGARLHFGKRKAVVAMSGGPGGGISDRVSGTTTGTSAGVISQSSKARQQKTPKTDAEKQTIKDGLKSNANLRAIMQITEEQLDVLTTCAYKQTDIKKGDVLIKEGDLFATKFFIVQDGRFQFQVSKKEGADCETDRIFTSVGAVGEATSGMSFGELALLYHAPRAATVACVSESATVWVIERNDFKHI